MPTYETADPATTLYRMVGLDPPGYRRADVARISGIEHERSVKWWRAMGFPEVPEDVPGFCELDVEIVRRLAALVSAGLIDEASIMRLARLLGASFSRIAEAQVVVVEQVLASLPWAEPDVTREARAATLVNALDEQLLGLMEETLVYVWRRHLLTALGRRLQADPDATERAIGFADLSGFTRLSQRVPAERLAVLVDEFEKTAFDVVAEHQARAVKLIGDEVMFVADSMAVAVDIGLGIAERLRSIEDMPDIHCGIAFGPIVAVGGDVFGPAANLAARLTTIARSGTIVIPRDAAAQLADRDDIDVVSVRRSFALKGIGDTRIVAVRRRHAETAG